MNYEQGLLKIQDILMEWCDNTLPFPDNVIVAARRVKQDIDRRRYWGESFEEDNIHTEGTI